MKLALRAIVVGWAVLLPATYLIERPLLFLAARLLGAGWFPTARLALDCLILAATGWVIGRFHRPAAAWAILAFALTLCFWDFDPLLSMNVPWLIQLAGDTLRQSLYLESLATTALQHVLLFGSLFAASFLSRATPAPASILEGSHR